MNLKPVTPQMKRGFLIALFFLIFSGLHGQEMLRYRLSQGDRFTIHQTALQKITQELASGTQVITNDIRSSMEFTILSETDSVYEIEIEFKDLKMMMTSDLYGELLRVDAAELAEGDIQSRIFHSLIGAKVQMKMTPAGEVLEVTGGDQLIETMVNSAGFEDAQTRETLNASLQKEFGSEALCKNYEQMTFFYPKEEVAEGETWQTEFEGKLQAHNTWTLDHRSANSLEISGKASAVLDVADAQTTMKLEGTQTSELTADPEKGFLRNLIVNGSYKGYSILSALGEGQIPTSIEMKLTYELMQ